MELEELRYHWENFRAANDRENMLSEEELYALLPTEKVSSFRQILLKTSRYVGVYGFLFVCCNGC